MRAFRLPRSLPQRLPSPRLACQSGPSFPEIFPSWESGAVKPRSACSLEGMEQLHVILTFMGLDRRCEAVSPDTKTRETKETAVRWNCPYRCPASKGGCGRSGWAQVSVRALSSSVNVKCLTTMSQAQTHFTLKPTLRIAPSSSEQQTDGYARRLQARARPGCLCGERRGNKEASAGELTLGSSLFSQLRAAGHDQLVLAPAGTDKEMRTTDCQASRGLHS